MELATTEQFAESEELRKSVAVALGRIADSAAIPLLISMLSDSLYWGRYPAEQALILIGEASVPELMKVARSGQFPANTHAIEALGRISDPQTRATDLLLELIKDPDWVVRGCAVEALGKILGEKSRDALLKCRELETHPYVGSKLNEVFSGLDSLRKQ